MDAFAFSESRYVNSHIDYETLQAIIYRKASILPNDKLSAYRNVINTGL